MIDPKEIKSEFPIFESHPDLIFLDNASTTQKPREVLNKLIEVYTHYNANVHRGLYPIAEKVNQEYEGARIKIAKFINANPEEIIFTSGTTDATNFIAESLIRSKLIPQEPKVLTTEAEHHANFLPWQRITDGKLKFLKTTQDILNDEYDVVAYSIISNVTGQFNDLKELKENKNLNKAIFIADAAQAIAHTQIDVKEMDIDFLVFSGHKMFGPTGVGVLYGKKELLNKMEPFRVGGGMIREVKRTYSTWAELPNKFEAGTPAIADAITLGAAVDFINKLEIKNINKHETDLTQYTLTKLKELDNINIYHSNSLNSGPVISFTIDGVHPHDIAQYLGDKSICVRAGHHCTQILHKEVFEIPASIRLSLSIYNTIEDIDSFIHELRNGINIYTKS